MREPIRVFFTMVRKPCGEVVRVGKPFRSKTVANDWKSFVKGAWNGCRVTVRSLLVTFDEGGGVTEKSRRRLDREFNCDVSVLSSG